MPELPEIVPGQPALTKLKGVPEGPQRKNHVVGRGDRPLRRPLEKTCKLTSQRRSRSVPDDNGTTIRILRVRDRD